MSTDSLRQTRIKRLRALIRDRCDGVVARFARLVDLQPSYLADVLGGRKSFGEKAVRALEKKLRLPSLYFDAVDGEDSPGPAPHADGWPFSFPRSKFDSLKDKQRAAIESLVIQMIGTFEEERAARRPKRRAG